MFGFESRATYYGSLRASFISTSSRHVKKNFQPEGTKIEKFNCSVQTFTKVSIMHTRLTKHDTWCNLCETTNPWSKVPFISRISHESIATWLVKNHRKGQKETLKKKTPLKDSLAWLGNGTARHPNPHKKTFIRSLGWDSIGVEMQKL